MPRRRSCGLSFSPKRALGISATRGRVARATGIPTTRQGHQRKMGRAMDCGVLAVGLVVMVVLSLTLIGCAQSNRAADNTTAQTSPTAELTKAKGIIKASVTPERSDTPFPSQTPTPSATPRATSAPSPSSTPRATSTSTPTREPSPTPTEFVATTETSLPTEEPTLEATAESTLESTVAPTETPSELFLDEVSVTSPVTKGNYASLTSRTLPGALCQITVYYKSGASSAKGLEQKTADDSGNVSWSWKVGSATTSGNWRIVVKAIIDEQEVTKEVYFTVQ
jgi:cytoskeletal protein RodZ